MDNKAKETVKSKVEELVDDKIEELSNDTDSFHSCEAEDNQEKTEELKNNDTKNENEQEIVSPTENETKEYPETEDIPIVKNPEGDLEKAKELKMKGNDMFK